MRKVLNVNYVKVRRLQLLPFAFVMALGLAASIFAVIANAQPGGFYSNAGLAFKSAQTVSSNPVARVDGLSIAASDLTFATKLAELNNLNSPVKVPVDTRRVLEKLVAETALVAEAQRRGIAPTDAEVSAYIVDQRRQSARISGADAEISAFAAAAGMSVDQYFASRFARDGARRALMSQELRRQILLGVDVTDRAVRWSDFATAVRTRAVIEIVDATLR